MRGPPPASISCLLQSGSSTNCFKNCTQLEKGSSPVETWFSTSNMDGLRNLPPGSWMCSTTWTVALGPPCLCRTLSYCWVYDTLLTCYQNLLPLMKSHVTLESALKGDILTILAHMILQESVGSCRVLPTYLCHNEHWLKAFGGPNQLIIETEISHVSFMLPWCLAVNVMSCLITTAIASISQVLSFTVLCFS